MFLCILVLEPEGSFSIKILLTFDIPFIFYDADVMPIIDVSNVITAANPEVDVTVNDVEITTLGSGNVTSHDRIGIRLTQIS